MFAESDDSVNDNVVDVEDEESMVVTGDDNQEEGEGRPAEINTMILFVEPSHPSLTNLGKANRLLGVNVNIYD